jgi:tRNA splicing endonuclease
MKHLKRFNEEVRHDYQQDADRDFMDELDRVWSFINKNQDKVMEVIEFWETSNGREFSDIQFDKWYDENMPVHPDSIEDEETNEKAKVEKVSKKDEIEDFIGKNKKNKSSYEMYKNLREKGYGEKDLKDYFYDNY